MNSEFIGAIEEIAKEKGIDKELLFEAIETSLYLLAKRILELHKI